MNATTTRIDIGHAVKATPGYSMMTKACTDVDEWTGRTGTVIDIRGKDAIVKFGKTEVHINTGRLIPA